MVTLAGMGNEGSGQGAGILGLTNILTSHNTVDGCLWCPSAWRALPSSFDFQLLAMHVVSYGFVSWFED